MKAFSGRFKLDAYGFGLLTGGFLIAFFFGQGIPFWDDDFTSWFSKIEGKSLAETFFEILSPLSTQPQYWGFNERPLQALVYQLVKRISGYDSWSYFLYKNLVYAGLGLMIYLWGLRLIPRIAGRKIAATAAAAFFIVTPGLVAAHVLAADFASTAELLFLLLTYVLWSQIEKTPSSWISTPSPRDPAQRKWMFRWFGFSLLTYLAYKSKADLKLIPGILSLYILLVRPKQWRLFACPIALMALLAIPWGSAIFQKLPPFIPGSQGSEIGWMWQPASLGRFRDFLWSSSPYSFLSAWKAPTLSLAGVLGPYLLGGIAIFLIWKREALSSPERRFLSRPEGRARAFVLIWLALILVAASTLPELNPIFRVRYGILTLVPGSLLLAWVFGLFAEAAPKIPRWSVAIALFLLVFQAGINLNRSVAVRRELGSVMVAVDQVYSYAEKKLPDAKLTLFPDFRSYDYHPNAPDSIRNKVSLNRPEDIAQAGLPYKTYAISWKPTLWEQVDVVEHFSGCRETSLFDRVFPCDPDSGATLMRYIGENPLYKQGEILRLKNDIPGALKIHEEFLKDHPNSPAGLFVAGLEAYGLGDWQRSSLAYEKLEKFLPRHTSVLYNYGLVLSQQKRYGPAIERLKELYAREPGNYSVALNLYWTYAKAGQPTQARELLRVIARTFPNETEVKRMLTSAN